MNQIKGLSIIQPFAHLIATGEKRIENRTWHTNYRGLLAIHASKGRKYGDEPVDVLAMAYGVKPSHLSFGAIVAVAELVDCVKLGYQPPSRGNIHPAKWITPSWAKVKYPWFDSHDHREGPVCWVLQNVLKLSEPIPMSGAQNLWAVPAAIIDQLNAQVRGSTPPNNK